MIIGIDEVGRGCWAGPVVAAAVELPSDHKIVGLNDSKKLSAKSRESIARQVIDSSTQYGIGWVWPREINSLGLTEAVRLAMQRAVDELNITDQPIVIDGNYNFLPHLKNVTTEIKADATVPAVSAASVIAKVARDAYMQKLSLKYPQYGFEKHVGYGTKVHIEALREFGVVSTIHRLKYKPIMEHMQ